MARFAFLRRVVKLRTVVSEESTTWQTHSAHTKPDYVTLQMEAVSSSDTPTQTFTMCCEKTQNDSHMNNSSKNLKPASKYQKIRYRTSATECGTIQRLSANQHNIATHTTR